MLPLSPLALVAASLSLLPQALAHGGIVRPFTRDVGADSLAVCGAAFNRDWSGKTDGNFRYNAIGPASTKDGTKWSTPECEWNLCSGRRFADNPNVYTYEAGSIVPIDVYILNRHGGNANVSVIDTSNNTVITTLKSWNDGKYGEFDMANTCPQAPPADQVEFSVTIPDLGSRCTQPGKCVIQWYWDQEKIGQAFESCIDFVQPFEGSVRPAPVVGEPEITVFPYCFPGDKSAWAITQFNTATLDYQRSMTASASDAASSSASISLSSSSESPSATITLSSSPPTTSSSAVSSSESSASFSASSSAAANTRAVAAAATATPPAAAAISSSSSSTANDAPTPTADGEASASPTTTPIAEDAAPSASATAEDAPVSSPSPSPSSASEDVNGATAEPEVMTVYSTLTETFRVVVTETAQVFVTVPAATLTVSSPATATVTAMKTEIKYIFVEPITTSTAYPEASGAIEKRSASAAEQHLSRKRKATAHGGRNGVRRLS